MKDLAAIGLPLQIGGFVLGLVGILHPAILMTGFAVHFVGDVLFFIQMKRQGCL